MVEDPANVTRFLAAVGEATEVPRRSPGRGPPYWKPRRSCVPSAKGAASRSLRLPGVTRSSIAPCASYNPAEEERPVTEPEEDFATLFEASIQAKRFERGQTIEGTIVAIGREVAFVNVGGKGEAQLDIDELKDADGALEVAVGDRIEAMVVSTDGGLTLSRKLARGAASLRQLEDAFRAGLPVEGRIERVVKGGYEVRIGGQRGFCPMSQIDTVRTAAPEAHQGQVYAFRIIEFKEGGKELVRLAARAAGGRAEGQCRRGPAVDRGRCGADRSRDLGPGVRRLRRPGGRGAGAAPRLRDGVVPRADPSQLLSPGQEITVKVLRVDEGGQRVALGLKQLSADPWSTVAGFVRRGPGARGPHHARRGVWRLRRAGAGDRGPGARLHVRADRASGRAGPERSRWG